jgi:four helix bundle protein
MKNDFFNFEKLIVYQKSLDYVDFVYTITNDFPKAESFSLTSQFIRAAISISLNIAEGAGESNAQFKRYLNISRGSIRECIVCSTIAGRRKYISKEIENSSRDKLTELSKMISGLISSFDK